MKYFGFCMLIGALLLGGPVDSASAEALSAASAINKAGRQRMLSQRMAKAYYQIGLNVRREEAQSQLPAAIALFELQLAELRRFASAGRIKGALDAVEAQWTPYRAILQRPYNRNELGNLMDMSEELLARTHKVVLLIQDTEGKPFLRLVNIAGRQRMLSQRLAKLYMYRQAGARDAATLDGLEQVKNEFKGALVELKRAPQNTPSIKTALESVGTQWELLEYSLNNANKPLEEFVALTSEKILNLMDGVTASYEELPGG